MSTPEKDKKLRGTTPEALQAIKLIEIAERLGELTKVQEETLKHVRETTPEGLDFPIDEQTVTSVTTVKFEDNYPYRKLRSVDFFNKGPDTVYVRINEEGKEVPLEAQEHIAAVRPRATISYVILRVDSGSSATVKMVGHV